MNATTRSFKWIPTLLAFALLTASTPCLGQQTNTSHTPPDYTQALQDITRHIEKGQYDTLYTELDQSLRNDPGNRGILDEDISLGTSSPVKLFDYLLTSDNPQVVDVLMRLSFDQETGLWRTLTPLEQSFFFQRKVDQIFGNVPTNSEMVSGALKRMNSVFTNKPIVGVPQKWPISEWRVYPDCVKEFKGFVATVIELNNQDKDGLNLFTVSLDQSALMKDQNTPAVDKVLIKKNRVLSPLAYLVCIGVDNSTLNYFIDQTAVTAGSEKMDINTPVTVRLPNQKYLQFTPIAIAIARTGDQDMRRTQPNKINELGLLINETGAQFQNTTVSLLDSNGTSLKTVSLTTLAGELGYIQVEDYLQNPHQLNAPAGW